MKDYKNLMSRRHFLAVSGTLAGTTLAKPIQGVHAEVPNTPETKTVKRKVALAGTGFRGITMWGRDIVKGYGDYFQFVGLCDINEGRLQMGKQYIGVDCSTFTDFEKMMQETKPEILLVVTVDNTHDYFICRGMGMGQTLFAKSRWPLMRKKIQTIIDAEKNREKVVA